MLAFREAVEAGDIERATGLLADDVVFRSPVVHTPYEGRQRVAQLLTAAFEVFEDFRYVHELEGDGTTGLVFRARVGDRELEGWDWIASRDGTITELVVMVRPLSGLVALAQAMGERLGADAPGRRGGADG